MPDEPTEPTEPTGPTELTLSDRLAGKRCRAPHHEARLSSTGRASHASGAAWGYHGMLARQEALEAAQAQQPADVADWVEANCRGYCETPCVCKYYEVQKQVFYYHRTTGTLDLWLFTIGWGGVWTAEIMTDVRIECWKFN